MIKIKILYKHIYKQILFFLFITNLLLNSEFSYHEKNDKNKNIKVALCTMGKKENLYVKEFVGYYLLLGVDHLFIYDNNEPFTEKTRDVLDNKYEEKITIYETYNLNISSQSQAFTDCYKNRYG